jgi:hypothetical protein
MQRLKRTEAQVDVGQWQASLLAVRLLSYTCLRSHSFEILASIKL